MRFLYLIFLFLIILFSCKKPPDYPDAPEIGFVSISNGGISEYSDSITIVFNFKDGDGDLGITEAQSESSKYDAYRDTIIDVSFDGDSRDTVETYVYRNFNITLLKKNVFGEFEEVALPSTLNARFGPLFDQDYKSPIDGELTHTFIQSSYFDNLTGQRNLQKLDEVKYEIFVYDRENNKSNVIETDPILLFSDGL